MILSPLSSLLFAAASTLVVPATGSGVFDRELHRIGEGVYVVVRPDVFRQPVEPNIGFVVSERDVLVIDTGGGRASAESALRLLRQVTDKPVRYIVNTHWHGDHNLGNAVFLGAFPGAEVISQSRTARDISSQNIGIELYIPQMEQAVAGLRKGIETGKDDQGQPLPADRLARWKAAVPDVEAGLLEYRRAKIERPSLTFDDGLTLRRGEREIQVRFLGRANTEGDAVVWLPQERILFSGDVVVSPLPYGFGSYPKEWLETLDKLIALDFATLVPGHGDVQQDASYVRQLQALIRKVQADVGAAAAQGATLEQARERLDLGPLAGQFTGGDARRQALFDAWFVQPFSSSAYKEAKGQPIVQGARE